MGLKKILISWHAALSLIGGSALCSLFSTNLPAFALPEQQIIEKLQTVIVFTIVDSENRPLVVSREGESNLSGAFISKREAEAFLERIKRRDYQVVPTTLSEIYQLNQNNRREGVNFAYVPIPQQVRSAEVLLRQQGQNVQEFPGVPVFFATLKQTVTSSWGRVQEYEYYLSTKQEDQEIIPFFFEKGGLEEMIAGFQQTEPELAPYVQIQVASLQDILQRFEEQDNEDLRKIVFWPTKEAIETFRSISQSQPEQ